LKSTTVSIKQFKIEEHPQPKPIIFREISIENLNGFHIMKASINSYLNFLIFGMNFKINYFPFCSYFSEHFSHKTTGSREKINKYSKYYWKPKIKILLKLYLLNFFIKKLIYCWESISVFRLARGSFEKFNRDLFLKLKPISWGKQIEHPIFEYPKNSLFPSLTTHKNSCKFHQE
jgi:hypothetical protein